MQLEWTDDQGQLSFTLLLHEPINEQLQLRIRFIDPDGEFQFYTEHKLLLSSYRAR